MMRFEYNCDCTLEERINIVIDEIRENYPLIDLKEAKMIAALSSPVDYKVTNDDIFERYYYMLLILKKGHPSYNRVLKDSFEIYNDGLNNPKLIMIMEEILKYASGDRLSFPLLSEFY